MLYYINSTTKKELLKLHLVYLALRSSLLSVLSVPFEMISSTIMLVEVRHLCL